MKFTWLKGSKTRHDKILGNVKEGRKGGTEGQRKRKKEGQRKKIWTKEETTTVEGGEEFG